MATQRFEFSNDELVPVSIWKLAESTTGEEKSVVILKEDHGDGLLPIGVGQCEIASMKHLLDDKLTGRVSLRPLTHELMIQAIEHLRGHVERGIITRLAHETFYGCLVLRSTDGDLQLDARPSDVICAALASGTALYALRGLLDTVSGDF